jgi:hypothetical protein
LQHITKSGRLVRNAKRDDFMKGCEEHRKVYEKPLYSDGHMADDTYDSDPYTPYENDSIIKIQH